MKQKDNESKEIFIWKHKAFKDIPIQMCHFHQKKIVQRKISLKSWMSGMKNMISLHRGLSKNLKLNLVDYYLVNYKKK